MPRLLTATSFLIHHSQIILGQKLASHKPRINHSINLIRKTFPPVQIPRHN